MSLRSFFARVVRGEDPFVISLPDAAWNAQYERGGWERLLRGEPHTAFLVGLIADAAVSKGKTLRILDVGCGNGGLRRALPAELGEYYVGVDHSSRALEALQEYTGTYIVADAAYPPALAEPPDSIVFSEVLYYIDPQATLRRYRERWPEAEVYISMVRMWRSPFLWSRIRTAVSVERMYSLREKTGKRRAFDICVGRWNA